MKRKLIGVFFLAASLTALAFGQHGSGHGSGMGAGSQGMGHDRGAGSMGDMHGKNHDKMDHGKMDSSQMHRGLTDQEMQRGSFKMMQEHTGLTADQLKEMYEKSGSKNYGQFVSAVMVSKNLNLDTQKVLEGTKTHSLGDTLQTLGVNKAQAREEIKKVDEQIRQADKSKPKA